MTAIAVVLAAVLAAAHVLAGRLRFVDEIPRSKWMSVAGGISVSYVFVHLLPELAEAADDVGADVAGLVDRPIYLLALFGLALFYGVERFAAASKTRRARGAPDDAAHLVTWFSFASYSMYNGVIGYLLIREHETLLAVVLFGVAMGVHFVINDHALREHHKDEYHRVGRWVVAAAVLTGAGVGLLTKVDPVVIGALMAFIAGGVVLNVMKEELPEERESSFPAFAAGAAAYTGLLLAI